MPYLGHILPHEPQNGPRSDEKPQSVRDTVLSFLRNSGGKWAFGGTLEDYIRARLGAKASNCSRRCRELEAEGLIQHEYEQVDGKGPHVVKYRYRDPIEERLARRHPNSKLF